MSNLTNVLSYKYNKVGHTHKVDEAILKETQQLLKGAENGEMLLSLLNTVAKSMAENRPVVSDFCKETSNWIVTSDKNKNEVSFMLHKNIKTFLIEEKEDFKNAFIFKDENINIWIIVDEANYDVNIEYINLARTLLKDEYKKIRLMIYSFDEIDEVKEELEYVNYQSMKEC